MTDRTWTQAIDAMTRRVDATIEQVSEGFPHYADTDTGQWTTSPAGDWTGGYWNGMLWLALHRTADQRYRDAAERWTELLRQRVHSETVFRGFLFWYGAAIGDILTGNALAREIALEGACGFATLYNPAARAIPLGNEAEEASDVGRGNANVDCVQGSALLIWAVEQTGDEQLREIGVNHALRHIEFCIRDDGSVCQSARFDPETGEMLERYTHKGYSDNSTWTRAQAWAMLGYASAANWAPQRPEFLATARRTADWWLEHIPDDLVCYWDFDAPPGPQTNRDTSGAAIATAALLKLAALVDDEQAAARYRETAEATARALVEGYLTPVGNHDPRPPGILTKACYNHRIGLATDNELIWGSYYLYESLHVLAGSLNPLAV